MTYLALQNLWQRKLQLSLSVSGVGLVIMLIILLNGFLAGIYRQVTAYLDHMPADFVVTEEGVSNLLSARSLLPSGIESRARGVAVHDISLAVSPGEVILIMGPSGSGKSTLLSMLGGLLKPSSGTIRIGERELTHLSERELPSVRLRHLGFIFQDFNLLSALSSLDNVVVVGQLAGNDRQEARQRAKALLEQLGLGHRLGFLPEKLSGGEKQRVVIARALVNKPDIILADEPTANLDSRHGRETMRLLRGLAKEETRSVIIVSHDQRIKEIADRVLWLEDGEFKNIVQMETDPVCGMAIEQKNAPAQAQYNEHTYYFCAIGCRDEFLAAPQQYLINRPQA